MITKQDLIARHNKRIEYAKQPKSGYGSVPQSLFKENGLFNDDNWNGGKAVIRQFTHEFVINEDYNKEYELGDEYGDIIVASSYFQDQQYYQITLRHVEDEIEGWKFTQYLVTYYKNRGTTELISKNGKPINFDEYVHLLNIIESTGFEFKITD